MSGPPDLGPKRGQMCPKRDKSGTNTRLFQIRFQYILARRAILYVLKSDLKKSRLCPILGQSNPLWGKTRHPQGNNPCEEKYEMCRKVNVWLSTAFYHCAHICHCRTKHVVFLLLLLLLSGFLQSKQ